MRLISRPTYLEAITDAFRIHPICALLGPRQCGKTTVAQQFLEPYTGISYTFDLEDPDDLQAFANPKPLLESLEGLIIIDEVQRQPELFPYLRVLVDRKPNLKILILGSASQELLRQSSETLAGRIRYIEMAPFTFAEAGNLEKLWIRGGFPRSYLADNERDSFEWRQDYIRTFLEKDIPGFGFNLNPQVVRRFWTMLTDYHGNIFNASELGRSLDLDHKTVKRYLDILTGTFMIRQLQPWFVNISKRQVKSCKIYFRDSGLLHRLLNIETHPMLSISRKVGASWEGFALEEVIRHHRVDPADCFFWGTQSGGELDLLLHSQGKRIAFEFKYSSTPQLTKSMHIAREALELDTLTVIIPGNAYYFLSDKVTVYGLTRYLQNKF